jgi:hypothetical protein
VLKCKAHMLFIGKSAQKRRSFIVEYGYNSPIRIFAQQLGAKSGGEQLERKLNIKAFVVTIVGLFALLAMSSTSALAGSSGSTGGNNASPWQVTVTSDGTDTFIFPKSDPTVSGGYRMSTNTHDWATDHWTIDGTYIPGAAGFPQAAWDTPTEFSGSADSTGTMTFKVKWVGAGSPPTYMYFALNSSASAAELSESTPAAVSGSNGQGDPFLTYYGGAGASTGTHAKRLKLNGSGEATYTVSMTARSTKTAKKANLGASTGASYTLDPKALSLFKETNKRSPEGGGMGPVTAIRASTGDIENEKAELGIINDPALGSGLFDTIPVSRIGVWSNPGSNFTSSISSGSRVENGWQGSTVESISTLVYYSLERAVGMRETPDTVTLTAHQTDSGAIIPGPFNSTLTIKVWAPERIITKSPVTVTTENPVALANGDTVYSLPANMTGHLVITGSTSQSASATVSLSRGSNASVAIPGDIVSLGVKQDVGVALGYTWTWLIGGSMSWDIAAADHQRYFKVFDVVKRYNSDRLLGYYSMVDGYDGDFTDTVTDVKSREEYHEPREVFDI